MRRTRFTVGVLGLCALLASVQDGRSQPPSQQVPGILLVLPDDPDTPYVRDSVEGFRQGLDAAQASATLYREFFDQARFGDRPSYDEEFVQWLWRKYRDRRIDLIVVRQQETLQLFGDRPDSPWKDRPVVYGTLGNLTIDISRSHPTASGVVMENYFPRLLDVITTILPATRRIAVIRGSSASERARDAYWIPQIRQHGLAVTDLVGLTIEQVLKRVATLPDDTALIIHSFQTDGSGRTFRPGQAATLVVGASNRPLFTLLGNNVPGLVGGPVPDFALLGRVLAAHALERLHGAPPSVETVPASRHTSLIFDARALQRWQIPESRLPAGSRVLFRPPSLWRDYRWTVVGALAVGLLQTLLIVGILFERRTRARARADLRSSYTQLQNLTDRLITAQEEERTRIARDLHDDIGQRLASLSISLSRLKREVPAAAKPAGQIVLDLQKEATHLQRDLRLLSHHLHPGALEHLGLVEAIRSRCNEFTQETGTDVRVHVSDDWPDVSDTMALCLYRVAQESLHNVAAHAGAHHVLVTLKRQGGNVTMQVKDDGRGFDTASVETRGLGLISLAERARMLGGRLDVAVPPGQGTSVTVTLPTGVERAKGDDAS